MTLGEHERLLLESTIRLHYLFVIGELSETAARIFSIGSLVGFILILSSIVSAIVMGMMGHSGSSAICTLVVMAGLVSLDRGAKLRNKYNEEQRVIVSRVEKRLDEIRGCQMTQAEMRAFLGLITAIRSGTFDQILQALGDVNRYPYLFTLSFVSDFYDHVMRYWRQMLIAPEHYTLVYADGGFVFTLDFLTPPMVSYTQVSSLDR